MYFPLFGWGLFIMQRPLDVLGAAVEKRILVRTKKSEDVTGVLKAFDSHINIWLEDAKIEGEKEAKIGRVLIRGRRWRPEAPPACPADSQCLQPQKQNILQSKNNHRHRQPCQPPLHPPQHHHPRRHSPYGHRRSPHHQPARAGRRHQRGAARGEEVSRPISSKNAAIVSSRFTAEWK